MTPASAIIFDLDDTLYPEREYAFSGYRAVSDAFKAILGDANQSSERLRALFDTEFRPRVFNRLLEEYSISADADLVRRMVDVFRSHRPTIRLFPDAQRALSRLRGAYRLGLITDGPAIMQRAKIAALKLYEAPAGPSLHHEQSGAIMLDAIIVTSELGPDYAKPHLHGFETIAAKLRVAHQLCVYIADNPAKDFVAPNSLGWLTVRVLRPDGVYAHVTVAPGGEPSFTIHSLDELDAILNAKPKLT